MSGRVESLKMTTGSADLHRTSRVSGYVVAVAATAVLLLLRLALDTVVEATSPFLFFAPAVMVSAWYGGRGPGLLATGVGAIAANYFLLAPSGRFSDGPDDLVKTIVFFVVGGQISWLCGALHAAKHRAESDAAAARRGEQLYRTLAQNFPDGAVFLLDTERRVVLAEGAALEVAGFAPGDVRGARLSRAFPRSVVVALAPLIRSTSGGSSEIRFGGRIYLVQVVPLRGTAGQRFAGMGIAQDVTEVANARVELQRAHDELEVRVAERTAELQFKTALLEAQSNACVDGILVASDDGTIIFHNRQLLELWGLPPQAFAGMRDQAVAAMRGHLTRRQDPLGGGADLDAPQVELPAILDLHGGRTLECYGAPVASNDGKSYGRVWYFRDVTERRRTYRQVLEAGERERQRIGQDLHDDLCQHLAGITCMGRVLHQRLLARQPVEPNSAADLVELVEQAVRRARDIARGLQPLQLDSDGLAVSLQDLAASIEQMFQIRCHVSCDGPIVNDDPNGLIHLYRITQEAISNAIRHGKAKNVYVDVVHVGERLILSIEDDGLGIDAANARAGLGMRSMRHRARLIGATLSIEHGDGGGTVVTCTMDAPATAPPDQTAAQADTGGSSAAA
jgi:signal transduction histidine kinase